MKRNCYHFFMYKYILIAFTVFGNLSVLGQSNLYGEYNASINLSDTVCETIKLTLNSDGTYSMNSIYFNSSGKWKKNHDKIKLNPNFFRVGCLITDNKTMKLTIDKEKLVCIDKSKINKRKLRKNCIKLVVKNQVLKYIK